MTLQTGNRWSERYSFSSQESHDAAAYTRSLSVWNGEIQQADCTTFQGGVTELWLGPIQVVREHLDQPFAFTGTAGRRSLTLMSVLPSKGVLSLGGRKIAPNVLVAFPSHSSDSFFCSGPIEAITVVVEEPFLASHLQRMLGRAVSAESLRRGISIDDEGKVGRFRNGAAQMLEEVAARPGLLENEKSRLALRELGLKLLSEALEAYGSAPPQLPPPSTRSYVVDRAIQYMDARLADPVATSDICAAVRVSSRTLRYSFEEVFGVSPARFLLSRRLARVRHDLLKGTTYGIHRVAQQYGFCHMGRFARFYRQAYGERPSDTCQIAVSRDRNRKFAAQGAA